MERYENIGYENIERQLSGPQWLAGWAVILTMCGLFWLVLYRLVF